MKIVSVFLALAMSSAPAPADNYYSWFSPEIADHILTAVVNDEYYVHLDFNGDGDLTVADAVGVLRRYNNNVTYGNELTVDSETVESIIAENYNVDCIYWEFDFVNNEPCRKYELTVDEITTANIYLEFADDTMDNVTIEINPFEEKVSVLS